MQPSDGEQAHSLHDIVIITATIPTPHGQVDIVDSVIVDGVDLAIPDDGDVVIEARASRHGMQTVTVPILAGSITYEHKEKPTDA